MLWSGVRCRCRCVGVPPADPPLPDFTQSRDSAVLKDDGKAALRANVLFQSGTQGARRQGPVRRYRGADPAAMSLRVNKEPSLTVYQTWHPPLTQSRFGNHIRKSLKKTTKN